MDYREAQQFIDGVWDEEIVPELTEYIRIPNKSPFFDAQWAEHGYMDQAVDQISAWCGKQTIPGMTMEVIRLDGRTPIIYMDIPGTDGNSTDADTILLYGHLDKQPEMEGWDEDKGPWKPVMIDGKLYGRGGADDGYAAYASLTAIASVQRQRLPHARCVVLIEACEESGSYDLPYYIDHLKERIGTPSLVVCLDSGAGNYEQLWVTTTLRGMVGGTLRVDILTEGVHSGAASGMVPSSFRIAREVLSRVEDPKTGQLLVEDLYPDVPEQRQEQTRAVADLLGDKVWTAFPFVEGARPMGENPYETLLNRNWRPTLSVTGAGGLPAINNAGSVLRPYTELKLSFRTPPTVSTQAALQSIKQRLEADPPYNAKVTFTGGEAADGWNAPALADWLRDAAEQASQSVYGASAMYMGEGGSIPFMGMLGEKFPEAQFMITGVLGPKSNAHGPNEFIHIPFAKKLTTCVASVIAQHYQRSAS